MSDTHRLKRYAAPAIMTLSILLPISGCKPATHTVTMSIVNKPLAGKGSDYIKVHRRNFRGGEDDLTETAPYQDIATITGSGIVSISASVDSPNYPTMDRLSCQITVDGKNLSSSDGDSSVSCSGVVQ